MNHSFNTEIATKYGMEEAVIFENLVFWCKKNKANNTNIKNGMAWTYNSVKAYEELFPYLTQKKIISALKNLEENGLITTGCFSNNPYDRTKWYAVTDKGYCIFENREIDLPKMANGDTENVKCNCQNGQMNITDINTDIKPNINTYSDTHAGNNVTGMLPECYTEKDMDKEIHLEQEKYGEKESDFVAESPTLDAKKIYLKKIYDAWSSHQLPLSNASRGNFAMFETIELRPVLSQVLAMAGQVDDVLQAIDNAAKVRDLIEAGGTWYSSPDLFRQFVSKIDRYLPGAFDIAQFMKKQIAGVQYVDDDKIEF